MRSELSVASFRYYDRNQIFFSRVDLLRVFLADARSNKNAIYISQSELDCNKRLFNVRTTSHFPPARGRLSRKEKILKFNKSVFRTETDLFLHFAA